MTTRVAVTADRDRVLAYRVAAAGLAARSAADAPGALAAAAAAALQDTPPGNAGLALAQRVDGVTAAAVERALVGDRALVAAWSVRGAPHVVPTGDLAVFTLGARPDGDESWRAWLSGSAPAAAVGTVLDAVVAVLRESGPLTKAELSGALHGRLPAELEPWCEGCGVHHVGEQVLRATGLSGRVCFGAPRDGRPALDLTERWLGAAPGSGSGEAARARLVRRFLHHHGPSTPALLAAWAGIGTADAARTWADAGADLVPVSVDGRQAWLHGDDLDAFMSAPPAAGVRLLPAGDPLLAARDRDVLVPDRAVQRRLWRPIGSPGLVLVGGRPAGLWRARVRGRRLSVAVEPLRPLGPGDVAAVEEEAARMAGFRGAAGSSVEVARFGP